MATGTVNLATLRRGKVYKHFYDGSYVEFKRNVPRPVTEELADALEDLIDTIGTEGGDAIEVDRFLIERNVSASRLEEAEGEPTVRRRLRMVQETVPIRKSPAARKVPVIAGKAKPRPGFGRRVVSD